MAIAAIETFAQNLRRIRLEQEMTQATLATRCGLSNESIASYEQQRAWPTLKTLRALAEGLGVAEGELFLDVERVPLEAALRVVLHNLRLEAPVIQPTGQA